METSSSRSIPAQSSAASVQSQPALDGALLSPLALLLIGCGAFGGVLFAATYLIEGATRPGYDAIQYAISVLSLGPGGWLQQVNFVIFGVLALVSAVGWRLALTPGIGRFWYPLLKAIIGLGLIVDGFFSQDPVTWLSGRSSCRRDHNACGRPYARRVRVHHCHSDQRLRAGAPLRRRAALAWLGSLHHSDRRSDYRPHRSVRRRQQSCRRASRAFRAPRHRRQHTPESADLHATPARPAPHCSRLMACCVSMCVNLNSHA